MTLVLRLYARFLDLLVKGIQVRGTLFVVYACKLVIMNLMISNLNIYYEYYYMLCIVGKLFFKTLECRLNFCKCFF